jgi:trk system potassium uptake protein TrkH
MQQLPRRPVIVRPRRPPLSPYRVVMVAFATVITLGTLLLALPVSHAPGVRIGLLDAFFTATSAVCVTGLIVVDTASAWSRFGQTVIMLLIQAGGLGIITLGTLFAFALGRRFSLRERLRLQAEIGALHVGGVVRLVRHLLLFTFSCELVGTLILLTRFRQLLPDREAAFHALFHSVSAFNNAGFALYPDSLVRFGDDPLVLLTLAGLFMVGGFSFVALANLVLHMAGGRRFPLLLNTRIATLTTALLVVGATLLLLLFEWSNSSSLGGMSLEGKLLAAFFQAVTPRTAGFNSIDYVDLREVSVVFTMLLMFIGANPASTGGGMKTVTFYVLLGSAWSQIRGRGELTTFRRRITNETVVRAGTIALLSLMLIATVTVVLSLSDPNLPFRAVAFETFSAFGTVGLSLGITADLSPMGKLVIAVLMFVGRLGPLTAALALAEKRPDTSVGYPPETVLIG